MPAGIGDSHRAFCIGLPAAARTPALMTALTKWAWAQEPDPAPRRVPRPRCAHARSAILLGSRSPMRSSSPNCAQSGSGYPTRSSPWHGQRRARGAGLHPARLVSMPLLTIGAMDVMPPAINSGGGHVPLSDRPNHFRLGPGRSVPAVGCSPTAPTITPQGRAARHGVHTVSPICTPCPPAGGPAASMRSTRSVCALPQDENPANGSLPSRGTSKVTMDVSHVSPSASPTTSNTPASIFRGCCGSLVVFRRCGAPNSSRSSQPACRVHQPVAHGFGFNCALGAF